MGKGEIARNEEFLLFPQCFRLNQITESAFVHIFDIISLFAAAFEEPKIGISRKELRMALFTFWQLHHLLWKYNISYNIRMASLDQLAFVKPWTSSFVVLLIAEFIHSSIVSANEKLEKKSNLCISPCMF